ncbi:ExeM/NucH family extracellular endonuclease [Agaribacterium sp. ZY112]|uniref:ExeM/NucH family extracellular endonuclease n=1 Tax=Agaribacterium sp. ZY112 TaxID=3233574 RepID=UPI003523D93B
MKKLLLAMAAAALPCIAHADFKIMGVIDGPLPGGVPKAVELLAEVDITDLSIYGLGSANNGGGSDGQEFTFPAVAVPAGEYIYVASEDLGFETFFDGPADFTSGAVSINGDDAIELFRDGSVVDVFGDIHVDGTGQAWDHLDGWAKRDINAPASTVFDVSAWTFSGVNALDNESSNMLAAQAFPLGEEPPTPTVGSGSSPSPSPLSSPSPSAQPVPITITELHYDNEGADEGEGVELSGLAGTDLTGWSLVLYNGNNNSVYDTLTLAAELKSIEGCEEGLLYVPISGIQNGAPDAIALVDNNAEVVEFISYEGSLIAENGPAVGMQSVDIGQVEDNSTAVGHSLQKVEGLWQAPAANTFESCISGEVNLVKIHDIQGDGAQVAISQPVKVSAIVTAVFQAENQADGFFIQEEDSDIDNNPASSEGIFVYCDQCPVEVAVGDLVDVQGMPVEFYGMSQIRATEQSDIKVLASGQTLPSYELIDLPIVGDIDEFYETKEGMLVQFSDQLSVAEYYQLGQFGQLVLSEGGRPRQFTDQHLPDAQAYSAHVEALAARTIILDDIYDGNNVALSAETPVYYPLPGLSTESYIRGGDTVNELTGVLQYSFSAWRIRPSSAYGINFIASNPRKSQPDDVGGSLKVASFNVLNYFTTINDTGTGCGASGTLECRGAHSASELLRQTQKIVSAVCAIDADIVGLMEIENPAPNTDISPVAELANAISVECGPYVAVETATVGTDAITVAFIYKPSTVNTAGETAILDSLAFTNPKNASTPKNRPAIAQSFEDLSSGTVFTVAVNHLKSKGSSCGEGDDSPETGQANCNQTRTMAAELEAQWLASKPTGVDSDMTLVIGDLNAYRNEGPIQAFKNAGYTDLVDTFVGADAYGYVFSAQLGYLDHGLANEALLPFVTGVTDWHINADEINLLDYNDTVLDEEERWFEEKPAATELFSADPYRSSDHDPLIIGLEFTNSSSIDSILELYHAGINNNSIRGAGRVDFWQQVNQYFFSYTLNKVKYSIEHKKDLRACRLLKRAYRKSDGKYYDMIEGPAVADINKALADLMLARSCSN